MNALDDLLRKAIAEKRLVSLTLHGRPRIGEPHDYGVADGVPTLFLSDLRLLEKRFAGARPAPSGRHKKWDVLYASVFTRE